MLDQEQLSLIERFKDARVDFRDDITMHRHVVGGESLYVMRDPITLNCHSASVMEYQIICHLTSSKSLGEIFTELSDAAQLKPDEEMVFYEFVVELHKLAMLNLPISDHKLLYKRFVEQADQKRKAWFFSFIFFKIPLINPDTFLDRTMHLFQWMFTRWFMFVWMFTMGCGAIIAFDKREMLFKLDSSFWSTANLLSLWLVLIVLKVIHEFGHGYACKSRGGNVTDMGIYMMAFTPCAYVDVTSSWGFSRKRDRILTAVGGIYFESLIAMFSLCVWAMADTELLKILCKNVFMMSTVTTLLVNANPLMRYDGYYVLSDLVQVPNLRQLAQGRFVGLCRYVAFGVKPDAVKGTGLYGKFLFTFGFLSWLYRYVVVLSIATMIAMKMMLPGIALAVIYVGKELFTLIRSTWLYISRSPSMQMRKTRGVCVSLFLGLVLPAFILLMPVGGSQVVPGEIMREHEAEIRMGDGGFLRDVLLVENQPVAKGEVVARYESDLRDKDIRKINAEYVQLKNEFEEMRRNDIPNTLINSKLAEMESLKAQYQWQQGRVNRMEVTSPFDGYLVSNNKVNDIGTYYQTGDLAAKVVSGNWIVKVLLDELTMSRADLTLGKAVSFRASGDSSVTYSGVVDKVSTAGSRQIDAPQATTEGAGDISVDPISQEAAIPYFEVRVNLDRGNEALRYGMAGMLKLDTEQYSVGRILKQKILRFLNTLNQE